MDARSRHPANESAVAKHQQLLLDKAQQFYRQTPISDRTAQAYRATPRHWFVTRYRQWAGKEWREVSDENLLEHLAILYADEPLILHGDDDQNVLSTISQPSFMLRMLDLLQLEPGQSVFELGTGSGWNAALISCLVGPHGKVYSTEIIPELAQTAAETIRRLGIENVHVVSCDGGDGFPAGAPYDRVAFTAGTYDLPQHFYDQMKNGGLLLAVIKNVSGGDTLFILRKVDDHFESVFSMACGFVQLTGKYTIGALDPLVLEDLPEWSDLRTRLVDRRPFWWGVKGGDFFEWHTLGIRSFLGVTEPTFTAFKATGEKSRGQYFGLWDRAGSSLVIAKDEELVSYGSLASRDRLLQSLHRWVDFGMPTAASFQLSVYKRDVPLDVGRNQWLTTRSESQFLWTFP